MARCISCRAGDYNESFEDSKPVVDLFEVFEGIWYCRECAAKYNLDVPAEISIKCDDWGTFNAAHK